MIVFAVGLSALMVAAMIGVLIWRDVRAEKERARLVNLLVARSPAEYAVLQRSNVIDVPKPDEEPKKARPVLEGSY